MQEVNAAYEAIKNPEKAQPQYGSYEDPFGPSQRGYSQTVGDDAYQQAAYRYILYGSYRQALNVLAGCEKRNARWYYLSALANEGIGNRVTALEHIRRAVSMEPDNMRYLQFLEELENGGTQYRRQAGNYRGFTVRSTPLANLCLYWLAQFFCCRGGFFCC